MLELQQLDAFVNAELYESSPDCIKVLSDDGTIRRLSPGGKIALELDRQDQLDGASWPSLWPGSERVRVEQAIEDARKGQRSQFLAFCPTSKNSPRWWDVVVTPLQASTPGTNGMLVVSRDVTELVEAREALSDANERKNEFLTVLSHELRNPLSTLTMAGKLLESVRNDPDQVSKISQTIARQVGHMSRLVEGLLDLSRITRGDVYLQTEPFDLRDTVHCAAEQLASTVLSKNQTLSQSFPSESVIVQGDRTRLTQVLGNLIGNASRYSPSDSVIDVCLVVRNGCASMTVTDKGQGISSELMPRLFEMYSQGQQTADRKAAGVGMGLAIAKGLIELHGGTIEVYSAGPGLGSTFTVCMPVSKRPSH
ncbi:sensor histidine kinase [Massilia phyllosphaerae]|uniref:sensor histidine kinase n=1 Tax=Massilia phyllosphaerae TaxID=3106034 RepID=UPI002B1CDB75|nr:PAS domain-containing sensor histidine kinase [Massilia sp. SGZ-792]